MDGLAEHHSRPGATVEESRVVPNTGTGPPPSPPVAFRVGVVGHRPNRLNRADRPLLSRNLSEILCAVRDEVSRVADRNKSLYADSPPLLRAVSPLAEGADRIFAEAALNLGYQLCCVMPFPKAEFTRDFQGDQPVSSQSTDEFNRILNRAQRETSLTQFELDGDPRQRPLAYRAASRVVLHQSDLLVVIWDGNRDGGFGGTEEALNEARRIGIPLIWIDAYQPHHWQLLSIGDELPGINAAGRVTPITLKDVDRLRLAVQQALEPPRGTTRVEHGGNATTEQTENPRQAILRFYEEHRPPWISGLLARALRVMAGYPQAPAEAVGLRDDRHADPRGRQRVDRNDSCYSWADGLAIGYGDLYRSAFILAYLLAAGAVGMALLPLVAGTNPHGWAETTLIALELAFILVVLTIVMLGRSRRWHERWLDYRLVAELLRHLRLVAPLGGERPLPQVPAQWAPYGSPGSSWMSWYVRAVERAQGLPDTRVDSEYVRAQLTYLRDVLAEQHVYHKRTFERSTRLEHRLHTAGKWLLGTTLLACVAHLLPALWPDLHLPKRLPPILTFLCGFLPALGAALAGISDQSELHRVSKRSHGMADALGSLLARADAMINTIAIEHPAGASSGARDLAAEAAALLVHEVLDWRIIFLDRPLVPPA